MSFLTNGVFFFIARQLHVRVYVFVGMQSFSSSLSLAQLMRFYFFYDVWVLFFLIFFVIASGYCTVHPHDGTISF